jgi:hypothetical protein
MGLECRCGFARTARGDVSGQRVESPFRTVRPHHGPPAVRLPVGSKREGATMLFTALSVWGVGVA